MLKIRTALGIAAFSLLGALPATSQADSLTFFFTSDHCTGGCLAGQAAGGSVVINTTATLGTLLVTVNLANGNKFINAGFDASFGFNLAGITSVTYSNITPSSQFTIPGGNPQAAGSLHMDGTGFFQYGLEGTGTPANPNGPFLSFNLTATGLTLASFIQNASGQFFAADVLSGTSGNTGGIDVSTPGTPQHDVPEPTPLALLALGLLALVGIRRRSMS